MTGAVIVGDRNVTHINTASDYYAIQRHNLQEFSQSANCETIIQQIYAWLSNNRKIRVLILGSVYFVIGLLVWLTGSHFTFMVFLFMMISAGFFLGALRSRKWGNWDVYPAIILEKRDIDDHLLFAHITIENPDGSRRTLHAKNWSELEEMVGERDHAIPGEIGIAVARRKRVANRKSEDPL